MEIRLRSCMYVCMVFGIISRTKACSATNDVSECRSPERALLRNNIIGVRLLTSARRAKMPKKVALKGKMHVNAGSSLLLVQKTDNYAKKINGHCLRLNHSMQAITNSDGGWALAQPQPKPQTCCLGPLAMSRILNIRLIHVMHALTSIALWPSASKFIVVAETKSRLQNVNFEARVHKAI